MTIQFIHDIHVADPLSIAVKTFDARVSCIVSKLSLEQTIVQGVLHHGMCLSKHSSSSSYLDSRLRTWQIVGNDGGFRSTWQEMLKRDLVEKVNFLNVYSIYQIDRDGKWHVLNAVSR